MARGRLRTKIRGYLGWPGKITNCGDHEWYYSHNTGVDCFDPDDFKVYHCYHCIEGIKFESN
jgi:hypothetical protein